MYKQIKNTIQMKEQTTKSNLLRYDLRIYLKNTKNFMAYRGKTGNGLQTRTEQHFEDKTDIINQVINEYGIENIKKIVVKPLKEYKVKNARNIDLCSKGEEKDILDLFREQRKKPNMIILNSIVKTPLDRVRIQMGM